MPVSGTGTVAWYDGASGYTVAYVPQTGYRDCRRDRRDRAQRGQGRRYGHHRPGLGLVTNDNVDITAEGTTVTVSTDSFTVTQQRHTGDDDQRDRLRELSYQRGCNRCAGRSRSSAIYTVSFRATTATPAGGDIFISEPETDFSHVTGILVSDANQGWHFVPSAATLSSGGARCRSAKASRPRAR